MASKKLKFLCSYGGKILPRPRDRKLRYVGGVMRIIQIRPGCSWEEFRQQMVAMYDKPHTVKYQLPGLGEDFHRLLSVSDDEELEDMMEYGVVDGGGLQKLIRLFLFPLDEDVDAHLSLTLEEGDSRTQYLSAVNGVATENRASRGFHSEPSNSRSRAAPRTQRSGPAALEDGLIEFEKEVEHANSVARSRKSMLVQNPSLGESISEDWESAVEDDEERILDTAVGKIDLRHMQEMSNKDLKAVKVLGSGGFGTVYHGKWKGNDVAIKRINKSCFPGRQSEKEIVILETFKEAGILSNLQHPNIVSLYGFARDESESISIVMELVLAGSLRNILDREDNYLDHRKRLLLAKGAASGMDYLHLRNVVHFDLKCDNLLVDLEDPSRPVCKVTDFGLSKVKQNTLISGGFRGTLPYMAPELLRRGKNKVSEKVDVYSFGIVMWEILTGGVPYDGMGPGDIIAGVPDNTLRPPVPASCDPQWRRLMEQCWDCDPKRRPSFNDIARRLNLMLLARS